MKKYFLHLIFIGLMVLALTGCGGINKVAQPTKPVIKITQPPSGTKTNVGQPIIVKFAAADVQGLAQIEITIDGQPARVEPINPPVNSYSAEHTWTPQTMGSHVIEVRAFNVNNEPSDPAQIFITVSEAIAKAATPTAIAQPATPTAVAQPATPTAVAQPATPTMSAPPVEPTATPQQAIATNTPLPPTPTPTNTTVVQPPTHTPTSAPTFTPMPRQAMVTVVSEAIFVRSGPGTAYPQTGKLNKNDTALVTGRNSSGGWWQIVYPLNSNERGWVSSDAQYTAISNGENVPVMQATAPPPPTPTLTPTPATSLPIIHSFTADRYKVNAGEKVILRWTLSNAKEAYLRYEGRDEGIVSPGEKSVYPTVETKYLLIARNSAGQTTAEVLITMDKTQPTAVPILRDGRSKIKDGQTIDFDSAQVYDSDQGGADFQWNTSTQKFLPLSGASGAVLEKGYENITLTDCLNANYNQPTQGSSDPTTVAGCFITSKDKRGKFHILDFDNVTKALTIEWLMWDY